MLIKRLFRNCWIIGHRFRLAHIKFGLKTIEVATFRKNVADLASPPEAPEPAMPRMIPSWWLLPDRMGSRPSAPSRPRTLPQSRFTATTHAARRKTRSGATSP
jgi:hypothetical protein